ncbi:MAG: hypothetical protein NC102_05255 [Clostridium sp.]|nr:hypothetical protein [Clostridium sp.]
MRHLILALLVVTAATAWAQRTTRPGLKPLAKEESSARADTIPGGCVSISGYEKTLRSTKESILCTNIGVDTISSIAISIEYLDMEGRQLHRRELQLACPDPIPPGQTRQLEFKSWDSQKVWYYRLSEPPRTKSQATPYDIRISPVFALKLQ